MNLPEYVSHDEVRRVCNTLQIRDWTQLGDAVVKLEEAEKIQQEIGAEASKISTADFKKGLEIELEHGLTFPDANVTGNHPILTGLIVLAHLKETLDYYDRLEVAELEGDILKAHEQGDSEKVAHKYGQLVKAKAHLAATELVRLHQVGKGD